jgi:ATP-dependent Clp protease ATP-binding subunit ClpC
MIAPTVPGLLAPPSADHRAALADGQRRAALGHRPLTSADVLCGLLRGEGAATRLLAERGITGALLEALPSKGDAEPGFSADQLVRTSHEIAHSLGARQTSSLHLLLALLRTGPAAADLLRAAGHEPTRLRAVVLRALTGPRVEEQSRSVGPISPGLAVVPEAPIAAALPMPGPRRPPTVPYLPANLTLVTPAAAPLAAAQAAAAVTITSVDAEVVPAAPAATTPLAATAANDALADLVPIDAPSAPVLGREREVGRLLDLLSARTNRIVCLIGDSGAGRSAVLAALASALPDKPLAPVGAPAGGISPGLWIEAMHRQAPPGIPLVLDGATTLAAEGSDAPAQLLATARAGRRWVIGATPADLRRFEALAPTLASNLETVSLSPLPPELLFEVVESGLGHLAASAAIEFSADVCKALLRLCPRYPSELAQPGRALTIAGIAAARAARLGLPRVTETEVAEVVADAADIPVARLLSSDDDRFATLEQRLAERVVGHADARAKIADVLRRSYAGFRGHRPLASFLLLGPTGVGKTETARAIADALFDGETALLRLDLSEYSEPHAVARLIGSPPGYVGHEEGGQLTEAIRRRPASVVLLDELEKAHREVLLLLLQVLEDGRLTDGRGRTVDFSAAAIVMTSNLGSECYKQRGRVPAQSTILAVARTRLPPELWNRIDEVLSYAPLKEAELAGIVARFAQQSSRRLEAERGVDFIVDRAVIDLVLAAEPDRSLGARPLRRAFERLVEGPIAARIVAGDVRRGSHLAIGATRKGEITIAAGR